MDFSFFIKQEENVYPCISTSIRRFSDTIPPTKPQTVFLGWQSPQEEYWLLLLQSLKSKPCCFHVPHHQAREQQTRTFSLTLILGTTETNTLNTPRIIYKEEARKVCLSHTTSPSPIIEQWILQIQTWFNLRTKTSKINY